MAETSKATRGIYAASISPLSQDGALDQMRLVEYCTYLISEGGCDGVAPCGTTGEGTSLSLADRAALPHAFAAAGFDGNRVIFGTGTSSVADTAMLTRAALDAGFPNVLVLPPFYYKAPSDEGVFAGYAKLIEEMRSDDLRLYLYHFPQMSMVPLSVDLVMRLRNAFGPIIAGLKDSSGDFEQTRAFVEVTGGVDAGFDVFPSSEAMLWDGLVIGTAGVISGSTNAFGQLAQTALQANPEDRDAAMEPVKAARASAGRYPLIPAMKQIEAWRSGDESWAQLAPPLMRLSEAEKTALRQDLKQLGL